MFTICGLKRNFIEKNNRYEQCWVCVGGKLGEGAAICREETGAK